MKMIWKILLPVLLAAAFVVAAGLLFPGADAAPASILPDDLRDGEALFSFPLEGDIGFHRHTVMVDGKWIENDPCTEAAVLMRVRGGLVGRLEILGCHERDRELASSDPPRDLGLVGGPECAGFLLSLVDDLPAKSAEEAVVGAAISRDATVWPRLLEIARDGGLAREVRESAVFWLGQDTAAKATDGLKEILDDGDEDLGLRKHAVFALSQGGDSSSAMPTLMEIAESSPHPQLREEAIFWLAQYDDPEVLDYFEKILLNK